MKTSKKTSKKTPKQETKKTSALDLLNSVKTSQKKTKKTPKQETKETKGRWKFDITLSSADRKQERMKRRRVLDSLLQKKDQPESMAKLKELKEKWLLPGCSYKGI